MNILGVLQNQWFKDPKRVQRSIDRHPEGAAREQFRRAFLKRALFYKSRTGLNLRRTFGHWCDRIVWEEASREIGAESSASFTADPAHLLAVIEDVRPVIVIGFGLVACCALPPLLAGRHPMEFIAAPHPTARGGDTIRKLYEARQRMEGLLQTAQAEAQRDTARFHNLHIEP